MINHPIIQAYISHNAFGTFLGMEFEIPKEGNVLYTLRVKKEHLATPIASHGGVIVALMDACLGVSALSMVCSSNRVVSTLELSTRFHAPALLGDVLLAEGNILKAGNRIICSEAKIYNQRKELIASAAGTFNAYPMEKAGF